MSNYKKEDFEEYDLFKKGISKKVVVGNKGDISKSLFKSLLTIVGYIGSFSIGLFLIVKFGEINSINILGLSIWLIIVMIITIIEIFQILKILVKLKRLNDMRKL